MTHQSMRMAWPTIIRESRNVTLSKRYDQQIKDCVGLGRLSIQPCTLDVCTGFAPSYNTKYHTRPHIIQFHIS